MQIVKLTPDKYKAWDQFCLKSDDAWFWHTSNWLEYSLAYDPRNQSKSESFLVLDNDKIIAICPLMLQSGKNTHKWFSFNNEFTPAPCLINDLAPRRAKKILALIFATIDLLAQEHQAKFIKTVISPLSPNSFRADYYNYLLEYDYYSLDANTQIINLKDNLIALEKNLRENHRRSIKKYIKEFQINIYSEDISLKEFDGYKGMHHLAAGRQVRPDNTFDLMYRSIKDGHGILFYVKNNSTIAGYYLITTYKQNAYYSSAAVDPKFDSQGVGHCAHWEIIKYLKNNNFSHYEIGWQEYSDTLFERIDDKRRNISLFKAGFGGFTKTYFQGIKFYDKECFKNTIYLDNNHE